MKRYQTTIYKLFVADTEYDVKPSLINKQDYKVTLIEKYKYPSGNVYTMFLKFLNRKELEMYLSKHPNTSATRTIKGV